MFLFPIFLIFSLQQHQHRLYVVYSPLTSLYLRVNWVPFPRTLYGLNTWELGLRPQRANDLCEDKTFSREG